MSDNASQAPVNTMSDFEKYFKMATILIKIVAILTGLAILFFSRFGFIVFAIAMLPGAIVTIIDRNTQSCASATVCTFNLIGVMPYIPKLWVDTEIDSAAKILSTDISTWLVIYGCALMGQIIFWTLPPIVAKLYILKSRVEASMLSSQREKICEDWNIKTDSFDR